MNQITVTICGIGAMVELEEADLDMSLDEFTERIVKPMVLTIFAKSNEAKMGKKK